MKVVRAIVAGSVLFGLASCGDSGPDPKKQAEIQACIKRGIAYFKEIGSYPTLSSPPNTGRLAADVAGERCRRTTTAFP